MSTLEFRAAVLTGIRQPLRIERLRLAPLRPGEVLVRVRASGVCHTDLEVTEGALRYPLPLVLGHEGAGVIEAVGAGVNKGRIGDHVILSWNPSCGGCFYCNKHLPILCEGYLAKGPKAESMEGGKPLSRADGVAVGQLMFLGTFAEYCVVSAQQAITVSSAIPFDRACLIGCAVMTGVGGALNIAGIVPGDAVVVIGCGAVGLAAVQGARMAKAGPVIAVDLDAAKLDLAAKLGATDCINGRTGDVLDGVRRITKGRGADVVLEAAGAAAAFNLSAEVVRPGGTVIWLGKVDVTENVPFRWGALMQEKQFRRSSYGGADPARDFPRLAQAYLDGELRLDELITGHVPLEDVGKGLDILRAGKAIRTIVQP